jgi:S-adenosylmethionine-diacylgycerolhomoserine-N-methlytransferase
MRAVSIAADFRVLGRLLRGTARDGSVVERLTRFYADQADDYDGFRDRLLHGRSELIRFLAPRPGSRLIELGAGTGRNVEFLGPRLGALGSVTLVDLCPPLLAVARRRAAALPNVHVVEADATRFRPEAPVDCAYFAYALSMIGDWRAAIDNAHAMLRPGGTVGSVDFFVSGTAPHPGRVRHGWPTRAFWPRWFAHDGVRLSPEPLDYLLSRFEITYLRERRGRLPYLPGLTVPYYVFVGRKRG